MPSELPTLRDILRYGIFLREKSDENNRNYTTGELAKDIYHELEETWTRANNKFRPPVTNAKVTVMKKIEEQLTLARDVSLGRGKLDIKENFMKKLDRLFDILNCKCDIILCNDFGCPEDCKLQVHISCNCSRDKKIPIQELIFIKGQREKIGSIGSHQMGLPDLPEHRRQVKLEMRHQEEERKRMDYEENAPLQFQVLPPDTIESSSDEEAIPSKKRQVEPDFQVPGTSGVKRKRDEYNTMEIPNVALQSIRYGVGLRPAAAIATAALMDAGLITDVDKSQIVDHSKVKRAQEKIMKNLQRNFEDECREGKINCIFFDGRQDATKVMLQAEDSDRQFPSMVKEEHYAVCSEPGGQYLFHFTPESASKTKKHAEIIADNIMEFMCERGIDKSIMAIGGDSTNVNTGWEGGAMHWLEVKLGRKLNWLVCNLHTNELPLRHLITTLDGKTLSNNKWAGTIGKMLDSATDLEINPSFEKIQLGDDLIYLTNEVLEDLSTDQAYGYKITEAIRSGQIQKDLALLEIGPVNHSRWLTTANRLCRLWVSKHGLKGENLVNLRLIVEYIIGVYYPCWFQIKVKHSWIEGPNHILFQLKQLRCQNKTVIDIVKPTVQRSSWYAFSEAILQTMLCSDNTEERKFAVDKIIQLRGEGDEEIQLGNSSVRPRKTPIVNTDAESLAEMIDWSKTIFEPTLTCQLTTAEVRKIVDEPMLVPQWPCHSQSIERCVKQVTEAAGKVFTHEKRDGYIRAQEASRKLMASNQSKQDLKKLIK